MKKKKPAKRTTKRTTRKRLDVQKPIPLPDDAPQSDEASVLPAHLKAAIEKLDRKFETTYIGKNLYRIDTPGGTRMGYLTSSEILKYASAFDDGDDKTLRQLWDVAAKRTGKYAKYIDGEDVQTENGTSKTSKKSRRASGRVAVVVDGDMPKWKQNVMKRASTQELIARINATTSAKPIAESDLNAQYELRLAKIAASVGAITMEERRGKVVFFSK